MYFDPKAKLCKDCKWCKWDGVDSHTLTAICLNIKCGPQMDPVNGKPLWEKQCCRVLRMIERECGWDAKHFQPKESV